MVGRYDVAVIGGGLIGLATARALLCRGVRSLVVLEAEDRVAAHQSGHNSGVIHSGLYYRPGSLKARMCTRGRESMYRFCEAEGIPYRRSGKLVVATAEREIPVLRELERRGRANGLEGLEYIGRDRFRELEPEVDGIAALWVREAGIVDYVRVAEALARIVRESGGEIRTGARVHAVKRRQGGLEVVTSAGEVSASLLINCAGLHSDRVARLCGTDPGVRIVPFRGEYHELVGPARGLIRNPIYPVPDPALPFLGVHFTPTIDGRVEVGPNAVLAWKREGYRHRDLSPRDVAEVFTYGGFWRLARKYWRSGVAEFARSLHKGRLVRELQRLVPRVQAADLVPGKSGVRAQAVDAKGKLVDDFVIAYGERSVHVLNAPSPAATASLGIGAHIAQEVLAHLPLRIVSPRAGAAIS